MAIQNDNTLVTKGDLKELYTDKIAPYLGGGISYYHTDRTGEELLNLYAGLSTDSPETDSSKIWTATSGAKVPFVKISGSLTMPSTGVITIPAGARVELAVSLADDAANTNTVYGWYNDNTNQPLENIKDTLPWSASGSLYTGTTISQWTNSSDEAVNISYRVKILSVASKLRYRYSHLSVQEIGRIVDPVKYVSNNSDLQETPVGNIISYMGNSVPKHYLACDGATYSIGTYPELEAFIIDEFGSINYFGGDGTNTWAVPDLRGEFLRGTGTNSHTNNFLNKLEGSGASVGEHQDATVMAEDDSSWVAMTQGVLENNSTFDTKNGGQSRRCTDTGAQTDAAGFYITSRPTNTSVQYCIKYETTYHVIVPSHAYKVKVKATISSNTNTYSYQVLDSSDVLGDVSLIDGNYFVAPIDGWYSLSLQGSTSGLGTQNFGIEIAGDPTKGAWNSGIGCPSVIYLEKGQKARMYSYGSATTHTCYLNFCLLTSNYNPTIVSADSVYSENEQMIGYWKDGKPLYQKTINTTSPVAGDWHSVATINNIGTLVNCYGYLDYTGTNTLTPREGMAYRRGTSNSIDMYISNSNIWASNLSMTITILYTKTTDTASSLQVENSLLLNRPDLWEVGTEYHFGGGLYGQRWTGTITTNSATRTYTLLGTVGATAIIACGGQWTCGNSENDSYAIGGNDEYNTPISSTIRLRPASGQISLFTSSAHNRTNAPYDVWVTYKK